MSEQDETVRELVRIEADMIESDLTALGATAENAAQFEIIRQEHQGVSFYRGIAKDGVLVWDRHPDWPLAAALRGQEKP